MEFLEAALALSAAVIKCAVDKSINNSLNFRISIIKKLWMVVFLLYSLDIFNLFVEDLLVLNACALSDFNISTVKCTECRSTIEHELHVTCTRCLKTCC